MDDSAKIPDPGTGPAEFFDWLVTIYSPTKLAQDNVYCLIVDILAPLLFLMLCAIAAVEHGRRHLHFIMAEVTGGFILEMFGVASSNFNLWWYQPGIITILGRRISLSLLCFYANYGYLAWELAHQFKLPLVAEIPVVGFYGLLLMFPLEIIVSKLLFWTWHSTDFITRDRLYGVSYAEIGCIPVKIGFNALFFRILWSKLVERKDQKYRWYLGVLCSLLSPLIAILVLWLIFLLTVYVFIIKIGLNPDVGLVLIIITYLLFAWVYTSPGRQQVPIGLKKVFQNSVLLIITCVYVIAIVCVTFIKPEDIRSEGLHEPLGPCNVTKSYYLFGVLHDERQDLCAADYIYNRSNVGGFDFHCLTPEERTKLLNSTSQWYTICGLPIENRYDFCFHLWVMCFLVLWFGFRAFRYSQVETPKHAIVELAKFVKSLHRRHHSKQLDLGSEEKSSNLAI